MAMFAATERQRSVLRRRSARIYRFAICVVRCAGLGPAAACTATTPAAPGAATEYGFTISKFTHVTILSEGNASSHDEAISGRRYMKHRKTGPHHPVVILLDVAAQVNGWQAPATGPVRRTGPPADDA
jgi:hypothetical protein